MNVFLWLLLVAVLVNALLVGASLDQSIKQLPARHRIGVVAFSEYSKAAAAVFGLLNHPSGGAFTTTRAAPINFSQCRAAGNQSQLALTFDRFTRWQTARVILQSTTLLLVAWVLALQLHLLP